MTISRRRFPNNNFRSAAFRSLFLLCCVCLILNINSTAADDDARPVVEELTESNWDTLIPQGKEVDAIYGDIVMQNAFLRAVIAKPVNTRNANMTVRSVGGCLIDLTTLKHQSDQLSAFYPARRVYPLHGETSFTVSEGTATVRGVTATTKVGAVFVSSPGTDKTPSLAVKYWLSDFKPWLQIESTWTNTTATDLALKLEDDLRADAGKEDMPKTPDGTVELFSVQDIYWQQAYGVYAPGFRIRCTSNPRESVLAYEPVDGKPVVLKPGEVYSMTRWLFVAQDLAGVLADYADARETAAKLVETQLLVKADGRPVRDARIALKCGENSW